MRQKLCVGGVDPNLDGLHVAGRRRQDVARLAARADEDDVGLRDVRELRGRVVQDAAERRLWQEGVERYRRIWDERLGQLEDGPLLARPGEDLVTLQE